MAADSTFGQLWRRLRIYAPDIPQALAEEMVNTAYSRAICAYGWSSLRGTMGVFVPAPETTGTIAATDGSTAIVGTGTAWTSALEGQQLVIAGAGPYFEVETVTSPTTLTLSAKTPFFGANVTAQTYSIQLINLVMPSDFGNLEVFVDATTGTWWSLNWYYKQELADVLDPQRRTTNTNPLNLLETTPSPFTSTLGRTRYELWPRPTGPKRYFYRYNIKPPLMTDDADTPIFPIRGDALREGAFSELAAWPGTADWKNPMYGLDISQLHDKRFLDRIAAIRIEDQNIRPTDITYEEEFKLLIPYGDWWQSHTLNFS